MFVGPWALPSHRISRPSLRETRHEPAKKQFQAIVINTAHPHQRIWPIFSGVIASEAATTRRGAEISGSGVQGNRGSWRHCTDSALASLYVSTTRTQGSGLRSIIIIYHNPRISEQGSRILQLGELYHSSNRPLEPSD